MRLAFVAMSMMIRLMKKCAKFQGGSPRGRTVNFNLASEIELSETADFVYNFV